MRRALITLAVILCSTHAYAQSSTRMVVTDPATGTSNSPGCDGGTAVCVEVTGGANIDVIQNTAIVGTPSGPLGMTVLDTTPLAASETSTNGLPTPIKTDVNGRVIMMDYAPCKGVPSWVAINTAASGNTELVALTSGQIIYICGWEVVVAGDVSYNFVYGTGSACGTGEVIMEGPKPLLAGGGDLSANAGAVQSYTAASNALCIKLSSGIQASGRLTYWKTATP